MFGWFDVLMAFAMVIIANVIGVIVFLGMEWLLNRIKKRYE